MADLNKIARDLQQRLEVVEEAAAGMRIVDPDNLAAALVNACEDAETASVMATRADKAAAFVVDQVKAVVEQVQEQLDGVRGEIRGLDKLAAAEVRDQLDCYFGPLQDQVQVLHSEVTVLHRAAQRNRRHINGLARAAVRVRRILEAESWLKRVWRKIFG